MTVGTFVQSLKMLVFLFRKAIKAHNTAVNFVGTILVRIYTPRYVNDDGNRKSQMQSITADR